MGWSIVCDWTDHFRTGAAGCIQYSVVFVNFNQTIHKGCNMVRSKKLSTIRFLLVTIEFVEKDTHDIFAVPKI